MNGCDDIFSQFRFHEFTALLADAKIFSNQRLRRGCAETDQDFRFKNGQLRFKPGPARGDLPSVRLFVNAAFAFWFPFEVLHRVGDVHFLAINSRFDERFVQQLSRWTDKRFAREIFVIARLFTDEDDFGVARAVTENSLRSGFPQRTGLTIARDFLKFADRWARWNQGRGSFHFRRRTMPAVRRSFEDSTFHGEDYHKNKSQRLG